MSGATRIWWDPDIDGYRMVTPYNAAFVDLLKGLLPASDRSWNASSKTWAFPEKWIGPVSGLVTKVFGSAPTVITKDQTQKASTPPSTTKSPLDKIAADFVRLVPYEAMRKAYLLASAQLHPDHGGDMDKMSTLNALWQRLEKELYGK